MPEYSAGTASVRIRPNADDFIRDLRAKLSSMRDPGFTVSVDADTAPGRRGTAQWRRTEEGDQLDVPVDAETGAATAEMEAWRRRQEANPVRMRVRVDNQRAMRDLGELSRSVESLRRSDLLRLNVVAFGAAGLQPAITGLAQVAAGLQQVSQAGLAIPGVMAGAAASIGTLVLGLSGIKDAYDAVADAATDAGKDQADQARAAAAASNQLRNANVDLGQAYKDVARATRDAKQELQDLRVEQRGGMLDESRALLEAVKAREDLMTGQYSDLRDAQLRVLEADQRVVEVRNRNAQTTQRLNDAQAKGVDGADQVVAANERVARAQQQVADAQLAAADAATKSSAAQDKAAQEMGKLGPNAKQVVDTLHRLTPAFQDFRAQISDPLLEGKAAEFESFFTTVRPVVERGLAGIAAGWNQNITAVFGSLGSEEGKGLLDRILGNTGDAQARLSAAIDPLIKGVGTLTAAGSDALPRLADALAAVSERFRDFITAADADGRLDKWINDGLDGLTNLGNTVLNLGKTFTAITQASGGGGSFLQWLEQATGRLQTFLNSAEGQNQLREYFAQGRDMIREVTPLLQELPGLFKGISDGASLYVGSGVLPILTAVADLLGEHPDLVKAAVAAYLAWNTVRPITQGVLGAINLLNTGLIGIGTNFAGTRGKVETEMGRVNKAFDDAGKPSSKLAVFSSRVGALGAVGGPIGILAATAIPGLITAFGLLNDKAQESAEKADYLDTRYRNLETTLDRVTGKITGQTLTSQIADAQNFDPGGPGGGVPGISQGDALAAAVALGISPELYGQGLINNPDAQKQIRDILVRNNIVPELAANDELARTVEKLGNLSGGKIDREFLARALIGTPGQPEAYDKALREALASIPDDAQREALMSQFNLTNIAQKLGPGQQAVLAGGALTTLTASLPPAGPTQQANQAQYGRFRVTAAGAAILGVPAGTPAGSQGPGQGFSVVSPNPPPPNTQGIQGKQNVDGSWTITVPPGVMIEKYAKGGPTSGSRNQGFLAELHGQEWIHDAATVDWYGDDVMNALWRKKIDPKALRALVPKFQGGGPTDPNDPNYLGIATGQAHAGSGAAPGPVAPNPTLAGPGIVDSVVGNVASGVQQPINMGMSLLQQFVPGLNGQSNAASGPSSSGGGTQLIPGLWGLAQAGSNPQLQQQWMTQTGQWLANWGANTLASFGRTLLGGVLGFFGADGLLSSPIVQGIGQGVGHFGNLAMQMSQPQSTTLGGMITLSDGSIVDTSTMSVIPGTGMIPYTGTPAAPLPVGVGNEAGLQVNTIGLKRAISAAFPQITNIGGFREDPNFPDEHPAGKALDVMTSDLQVGNQIVAHAFKDPNVDYAIWQGKTWYPDGSTKPYTGGNPHTDHVHLHTTGGGYPGANMQYFAPNAGTGLPIGFLQQLYNPQTPAASASATGGGADRWRPVVRQALQQLGPKLGITNAAAWENALIGQIQFESKGDPNALNPKDSDGLPAIGLGQFKQSTFDAHNVLGGSIHDGTAQIYAMIDYVMSRYGQDEAGVPKWINQGHGYDQGGWLMPGLSINATRQPEAVLTPTESQAFKTVAKQIARPQPTPQPQIPDARQKIPEPAFLKPLPQPVQPGPTPPVAQPAPQPSPPPAATQPPSAPPPAATQPSQPVTTMPGPVAPGPAPGSDGITHTLPWIDQAIDSGASALGQALSTALGIGGAAAGGFGGTALGAIGPYAAGLVMQGGKVVKDVANVISSALVGSVPGSFTDTPSGVLMRAQQNRPATAEFRGGNTYNVRGYEPHAIYREIQANEALDRQAMLATRRG